MDLNEPPPPLPWLAHTAVPTRRAAALLLVRGPSCGADPRQGKAARPILCPWCAPACAAPDARHTASMAQRV